MSDYPKKELMIETVLNDDGSTTEHVLRRATREEINAAMDAIVVNRYVKDFETRPPQLKKYVQKYAKKRAEEDTELSDWARQALRDLAERPIPSFS